MRSDTAFATMPTTTTMDMRNTLLTEFSGTSLDDLCKILAAICLCQANEDDNRDNNSTSQNANDNTVFP